MIWFCSHHVMLHATGSSTDISKSLKCDNRDFNTDRIKEAIEHNKGSKVFARDLSLDQSQLTALKTEDGGIVSSKPKLMTEIEKFYGRLYTTTQQIEIESNLLKI